MKRPMYYDLDGHDIFPVEDFPTHLYESQSWKRIVAQETLRTGERVSTVFLALDHGYGDEPPVVFETMVFGGDYDEYTWRYSTWDEALETHNKIVRAIKYGEELPE